MWNGANSVAFYAWGTGIPKNGAVWENLNGYSNVNFNYGGGYNPATSEFNAPLTGKYLFAIGGYSPTSSLNPDRIAFGIRVNGALHSFTGGQFASGDTPLPGGTFLVFLTKGDRVGVSAYTAIPATLGSFWTHHVFFQGIYLGP